jgi:SRSO17 transposase
VQRQDTGTAGRIENAQVAVYLVYASNRGHAPIDRELYLPRCWIADPQRLTEAGVPDDIDSATKPALSTGMLSRALRAGVPARWATGDEVYGNDPGLRRVRGSADRLPERKSRCNQSSRPKRSLAHAGKCLIFGSCRASWRTSSTSPGW